jgi:hypothetical protein
MRNIWLIRKEVKNNFPVGRRVRVIGPFDVLNEPLFRKYVGKYGIIVDYMFQELALSGWIWVGIVLDINNDVLFNNITWFAPSEIELYYEDYIC